jgi:hypothetical protein
MACDFVYTYGDSRDVTLSMAETGGTTVETGTKNSIQSQLVSARLEKYITIWKHTFQICSLQYCIPAGLNVHLLNINPLL